MKKIIFILSLGTGLFASGIPVVDVASLAKQALQYINQVERLKNQIEMVKMQVQNMKNIANYDWTGFHNITSNLNTLYYSSQALTYKANETSRIIDDIFQTNAAYYNKLMGAQDTAAANKAFSEQYQKLLDQNRNEAKGSLAALSKQFSNFNQENSELQTLKKRSNNAKGNLEALQAAGDLSAYQIDELKKLRLTLMNQHKYLVSVEAAKSAEKELEKAREEQLWGPGFKLKPPVHGNANDRL